MSSVASSDDWKSGKLPWGDGVGQRLLQPVIRFCGLDDPRRKWKKVLESVVIPAAACCLFLFAWTLIAPHHRTKSGEVPTPAVVWRAACNIWLFHLRESDKAQAYQLEGAARETKLAQAQARLAKVESYVPATEQNVARAEQARNEHLDRIIAPLKSEREATQARLAAVELERRKELAEVAAQLAPGDLAGKERYLQLLRQQIVQTEQDRLRLRWLDDRIANAKSEKFAPLSSALALQSQVAEERQYLTSLIELLDQGNRSVKLAREVAALKAEQRQLIDAPAEVLSAAATRVVAAEKRIEAIARSRYARPWTLPMQICRSVVCVFVGFVIGSAIAIPLGVVCGLSSTAMAAMTPFIALFKPVSPIVWLPIALIVVGGFIPDPDKHWLIQLLADLPVIGWLRINPAFMASAVTVALCSLWATLVNTALGVSQVEQDHLNVARVLQLGTWDRLRKIILPAALPLMFTGLRISLGVGWMVLIAGELLSASEGIGKFVWDQFNNGAADSFAKMVVVVFMVGGIGFLLDRLMVILQRLVSFDARGAEC